MFARRPESLVSPQFWAEDATLFFHQARELGLHALLEPYAGYLHLLPRLVAAAASQVDLAWAPLVYSLAAGLGALYVVGLTLGQRFPLPASPVYAILLVLVPDAYEVLWHLVNVQWVLALGLLIIVTQRAPGCRLEALHDLAAVVFLGLTGPFAVTLLPIAAWRCWRERSKFSVARLAAFTACSIWQGLHLVPSLREFSGATGGWEVLLAVPGIRSLGSILFGGMAKGAWLLPLGWFLGLLFALLIGLSLIEARRSPARATFIWAAGCWCALGVLRSRSGGEMMLQPGLGGRYFFPVQAAFLWWMASHLFSGRPGELRVALFCLGGFFGSNLHRWRETPLADFGWRKVAEEVRAGTRVEARINPNWSLVVHPLNREVSGRKRGFSGPVTASLLAADRELNPDGDRMSLLATVSSPSDESGVVWEIVLPSHWVLLGITAPEGLITGGPRTGAIGALRIPLAGLPGGRAEFTLQVSYPPDSEAAEIKARVGRSAGDDQVWFGVEPARWRSARR